MVLILFTMAFVLGPALFLVLLQYDGRRWPLALLASVLVVMSFIFRSEASLTLGADRAPVFLSVLLLWLAWVLVMVVVARALQAANPTLTKRRWSRAICAMGTTVPWFGFATAQMMAE